MGFTEDGPESGYHQYTSPLPPNHLIYLLYLPITPTLSTPLTKPGTNGPTALWSSIETNVAIICASLPALYPLLTRLFPRLIPSSLRSKSKSKSKSSGAPSDISLAGVSGIFREDGAGYRADVVGGAGVGVDGDGEVEVDGVDGGEDGEGIKVVREVRLDSGDEDRGEVDGGPEGGGEEQMGDAVEQVEEWELEWRERLERKRRRREEEAAHS